MGSLFKKKKKPVVSCPTFSRRTLQDVLQAKRSQRGVEVQGRRVITSVAAGLEPVVDMMLESVQTVEEGAVFRFGWSELRLTPFEDGFALVQRDWMEDPAQWVADLTVTALLARTFGEILASLTVETPDSDMLLDQTVSVDSKWNQGPLCSLYRGKSTGPDHSGWVLTPFPPPDAPTGAPTIMPAYQLLKTFPAAVPAMGLPYNFTVVLETESEKIMTILDPRGEEALPY